MAGEINVLGLPVTRRAGRSVWIVLPLLLLGAACADAPESSLPDLVVEVEGDGPLESDRWVEAAREVDLGRALAVNSLDFTIEEFTSTRTAGNASSTYFSWDEQFGPRQDEHIVYAGPTIMLPLSVTEDEDGGSAAVEFCVANASQIERAGEPRPARDLADGVIETWNMVLDDDLGRIVVDSTGLTGGACDAAGAPAASFDPAPVLPETIDEGDVRAPERS